MKQNFLILPKSFLILARNRINFSEFDSDSLKVVELTTDFDRLLILDSCFSHTVECFLQASVQCPDEVLIYLWVELPSLVLFLVRQWLQINGLYVHIALIASGVDSRYWLGGILRLLALYIPTHLLR